MSESDSEPVSSSVVPVSMRSASCDKSSILPMPMVSPPSRSVKRPNRGQASNCSMQISCSQAGANREPTERRGPCGPLTARRVDQSCQPASFGKLSF